LQLESHLPAACPECGTVSRSRHSSCQRMLRDLPTQGDPVLIQARATRWRCRNKSCDRLIFTERLPQVAAPYARRTARLTEIMRLIGHSAEGRSSERLMGRLGMPVSDTTILRSVWEGARSRGKHIHVRIVEVGEWAWRKGFSYGTIVVDLKRRQVVDLLAGRSASILAAWLMAHPELEIMSRDRAGLYAGLMGWTPPTAPMCQSGGVEQDLREAPVLEVTTIGLDLAKHTFQLHGADQ
jgi:transposase